MSGGTRRPGFPTDILGRMRRATLTLLDHARGEVRHSRPRSLVLAPTSRCNGACTFCADFRTGEPRTLALAEFETLLGRLAPDLRLVDFSFYGEPLLNPDLAAMISHARQAGLETILHTNGLLLDEERVAALAGSGVHIIVVNVNAWAPDSRIDPAALPPRLVRHANGLVAACAPGTLVVIQEMVGDRDPSHRRELEALFSAAPNRVIRTKVRERYSSAGPRARPGPVHCIRPFEEIAVGPDGHVALCCNDILREHDFGNLLEDDPEEIWVRRMNALRRDNRSPLCLGCRATGQGPGRFMAATLMSPVGARRRFLRLASILARAASVCRSPSQPGCPGGPSS